MLRCQNNCLNKLAGLVAPVMGLLELDSMIPSLIVTWNHGRIKLCMEDVTQVLIMEGSKKFYVAFILGIVLLGWGPTVKEHADTTHVFLLQFFMVIRVCIKN